MKKLVIFGGSGYLGTNLAKSLSKEFAVTVTGRYELVPFLKDLFSNKSISYHKIDIRNLIEIFSIIDQNDYIIHAVPNTQPHQIKPFFHSDFLKIIKPSEKIFDYATKRNKRIIFLSSGGSVYGAGNYIPHSEDSDPDPIDQYGKYKLMLDKSLLTLNSRYISNNIVLRIANPYGGTFNNHFKQGFINSVIRNLNSNNQVEIWGNGKQIRDFIYIKDLVNLVRLILDKDNSAGIFNCGTGIGHSLTEIIEISEEILMSKINVKFIDRYQEKIPFNILNINKSMIYFDWKPENNVRETLFNSLRNLQ
jgi:UDP-glucose 4-epimerase